VRFPANALLRVATALRRVKMFSWNLLTGFDVQESSHLQQEMKSNSHRMAPPVNNSKGFETKNSLDVFSDTLERILDLLVPPRHLLNVGGPVHTS